MPDARIALVTGANHGIGAATAKALAAQGTGVLCTYFRDEHLGGLDDPALPAAYRATRMARADNVAESIRAAGGRAAALEADLSDASSIPSLFEAAEAELGPVSILVNNASGWVADSFVPDATNRFGLAQAPVSAQTIDQVFGVDARAAALLIAEFARRHVARGGAWGRIIGLDVGRGQRIPRRGLLRGRQGGPGQPHPQRSHRAGPFRRDRQRRAPADDRHRLDQPAHRRDGAVRRPPRRHAPPGRRRHCRISHRTPPTSSPATSFGFAEPTIRRGTADSGRPRRSPCSEHRQRSSPFRSHGSRRLVSEKLLDCHDPFRYIIRLQIRPRQVRPPERAHYRSRSET